MSFPSAGCMGGSVAAATSPSPPAAEWLLCPPAATRWIPTPGVPPYPPVCPCIPTSSGTCPGLSSPATATHHAAAERGLLYVASRAAWTYSTETQLSSGTSNHAEAVCSAADAGNTIHAKPNGILYGAYILRV